MENSETSHFGTESCRQMEFVRRTRKGLELSGSKDRVKSKNLSRLNLWFICVLKIDTFRHGRWTVVITALNYFC